MKYPKTKFKPVFMLFSLNSDYKNKTITIVIPSTNSPFYNCYIVIF